MKRKQTIDLGEVKMNSVYMGDNDIEVEVTTKHGVARLTMDLSSKKCVGLSAVLPSGKIYTSEIDSWASDEVDDETEEELASIMRLSAGFVVQCFEKEIQKQN